MRSKSASRAGRSFFVSEKAGPWKATTTQGSVSDGHGTCAVTGPFAGGSCGIGSVFPPLFQPPQYFSTRAIVFAGSTSPATMIAVCSGRYQRSKKIFEYANWLGMSSMSLRKPIVVCLYVWTLKALSRVTS